MKMSDVIEQFLLEMLQDEADIVLKRNELASRFACAPSQINYVIGTRFTGQRGYEVESQRGGGGYIRIRKVAPSGSNYMMHVVNAVGEAISYASVQAMVVNMIQSGIVTEREGKLICAAVSDRSLPIQQPQRDQMRAIVFKNMLISLV